MSFLHWPNKDPNEVLDYTIDWSARLLTDTIVDSDWTVPVGIIGGSDSFTTASTLIWLSGGSIGEAYDILNRVTTAGGRIMDQTVRIKIKER